MVGEQHGAHPASLRQSQQQAREQDGAQKHSYTCILRVRKVVVWKKYFLLLSRSLAEGVFQDLFNTFSWVFWTLGTSINAGFIS
jgi:hypothetical protein